MIYSVDLLVSKFVWHKIELGTSDEVQFLSTGDGSLMT